MSRLNNDGLRHDKTIESIMLILAQFQTTCYLRIEISVARCWLKKQPNVLLKQAQITTN